MPAKVRIRDAIEDDVEELSRFLGRVWLDTYAPRHGEEKVRAITRRWHNPERLRSDIADTASMCLVASVKGRIVGHAYLRMVDESKAMLHRLYVDPNQQRSGIGKKLLAELDERLPAVCSVIELEVDRLGLDAIAFYRGNGFVEAGEVASCGDCTTNIPALLMRRERRVA